MWRLDRVSSVEKRYIFGIDVNGKKKIKKVFWKKGKIEGAKQRKKNNNV